MRPEVTGGICGDDGFDTILFERDTVPPPLSDENIAGNSTSTCVCIGNPAASNEDTLEVRDEADASCMFVNPAIVQTMGCVGDAGAAAVDN